MRFRDSITVNKLSPSASNWRERLNSFYFSFICIGQLQSLCSFLRGEGLYYNLLLSRHAGIFLCLIYSVRYVGIIIETFSFIGTSQRVIVKPCDFDFHVLIIL